MAGGKKGGSWTAWVATAGLALASAGGFLAWKHQELLTAWKVHQLPQAGIAEQRQILSSLAENPDLSTGWLLYSLSQSTTPEEAEALGQGLVQISENLSEEALDTHVARAASLFKTMEPFAQAETMTWLAKAFSTETSPTLTERRSTAIRRLMDSAYLSEENSVQAAALQMSVGILKQNPPAEVMGSIKQLVSAGAKSESSQVQIQAITVALNPKTDCLQEVAICLKSPHKEVRQAAILALGPASETIMDEVLLPSLHDEDQTIVHLTETALQARGLREDQIRLGKLMADPKPVKRLEVLDHLSATRDIDPMIWLKKMSNDPSPAVRAAAARAMIQEKVTTNGNNDRKTEKLDMSESVKRLAGFYEETKPVNR